MLVTSQIRARQYTGAQWQDAKPMIEYLYLRGPLSSVVQIMESRYQFKAT
jgi:hypothetical protein